MQMPNVRNVLRDEENNIEYEVLAYRRLTEHELIAYVRMGLSMRKNKRKLKRGTRIQFTTIIGQSD